MTVDEITLRATTRADTAAVDALLAKSYPRLLKADYPPSVMVTAVPIISRARPELMTSGTFYGAWLEDQLVGVGGWTPNPRRGQAEVRHVATDPDVLRRGVGRAILGRVIDETRGLGLRELRCMATRTAVPFYAAMGFEKVSDIDVTLTGGISFPAVQMWRSL